MIQVFCKNPSESKGLTLSYDKLEAQFKYLISKGYTSLHFRDIQRFKHTDEFPKKPIIKGITIKKIINKPWEVTKTL